MSPYPIEDFDQGLKPKTISLPEIILGKNTNLIVYESYWSLTDIEERDS